MKNLHITQEIWKEGKMFIAYCPELDIPASGNSIEEAKLNLKSIILINFEEMVQMDTLKQYLDERGFDIGEQSITYYKEIIEFKHLDLQVSVL